MGLFTSPTYVSVCVCVYFVGSCNSELQENKVWCLDFLCVSAQYHCCDGLEGSQ